MDTNTEHGLSDESGDGSETYLTIEKRGDTMAIGAVVDGEQVFFANPDARRSDPVLKAAVRTFGRRGWPELADEHSDNGNGGAFQ